MGDLWVPGKPIGRRLFLGLLGAGAAGLAFTKWSYRADDADSGNVAEAVPLGPMGQTPDIESLIGQHPNILYPERFRYYSVADIPGYSERSWRLIVDGEGLDSSLRLRFNDVTAFPNVAYRSTFRCVNGWRVRNCVWRGVRVRDVIDAAHLNRRAKYVTFSSGDGIYTDSLSLQQARSDHAILAFELNGSPLITEQGRPLRVIFPDMYGYKGVKWVRRLEVKSHRDLGFWEQRGWEIDAYVYNPSAVTG
ncbi:MAG: hypothetical protein E6J14_03875 [Chloroflexi bacterium]|nr:MAG: hypothetical protein E6J14_03875 [Chloroflexota bacterium]